MEFVCIAHRGARGYEPENTIRAIKRAIELGATWIEIDIHYIDETLLVSHDSIIMTNNVEVDLYSCSYQEIRNIQLAKNEKIPTLAEVLFEVKGRACLNIELKGVGTASPTAHLLGMLFQNGEFTESDFQISSFIPAEIVKLRSILSTIPIGILVESDLKNSISLGTTVNAYSINIPIEMADPENIQLIHSNGFKCLVYTANNESDIRRMYSLGADGVFTDYIDKCHNCLCKEL